ncbi:MAG TPA: hypothetical protein EYH07_04360, partial [Kiloniellaceae bacterium]|nr:hypothetical protein [Kiloniellaceae bacterium]
MPSVPEDEQASADTGGKTEDAFALAMAAEVFGFDPDNREGFQPGVEDLQKALIGEGLEVTPDGILGKQTIMLLQDGKFTLSRVSGPEPDTASISRSFSAAPQKRAAPEASLAEQLRAGDLSMGAARRYQDEWRQEAERAAAEAAAKEAEPQPEPPGEPDEPAEAEQRADAPAAEEAAAATARPIALSDSAIEDVDQDRLGFRPYVEAVADFILAEQTQAPLAIAVNAPWGKGKTSFMNMIDAQLRRDAAATTVKVATLWFNPWKYSEPEQVWAAFVANVTRCLRANLTPWQSWRFRFERFRKKLARHWDLALAIRTLVAVAFLSLVAMLALMDWRQVADVVVKQNALFAAFDTAAANLPAGFFWYIPLALAGLLGLIYLYVTFTKKLGLNLL